MTGLFSPLNRRKARETRRGNDLVSRLNGHLFSRTGDITNTRAWEPEDARAEGNDSWNTDARREMNNKTHSEERDSRCRGKTGCHDFTERVRKLPQLSGMPFRAVVYLLCWSIRGRDRLRYRTRGECIKSIRATPKKDFDESISLRLHAW